MLITKASLYEFFPPENLKWCVDKPQQIIYYYFLNFYNKRKQMLMSERIENKYQYNVD